MEKQLPKLESTVEPSPIVEIYACNDLIPPLLFTLSSKKTFLLDELFILLIRANLSLPAVSWKSISELILKRKIKFFKTSPLFPKSADSLFPSTTLAYLRPPQLSQWNKLDGAQKLRWLKLHFLESKVLDSEKLQSFWTNSSTPQKQDCVRWLYKIPSSINLDISFMQKLKSSKLKIELQRIDSLRKNDDYKINCNLWSTFFSKKNSPKGENLHLIDIADLNMDYPIAAPLSLDAKADLLEGALLHQNINAALQLSRKHSELINAMLPNCISLSSKTLSSWLLGCIQLPTYSAEWLWASISSSKAYWPPILSEKLITLSLKKLIEEKDTTIWCKIITTSSIKGDPKLLPILINFKERNPHFDRTTIKTIEDSIKNLHLRLQMRRAIMHKKG